MATDIFLLDTNILSESSRPRPHPTISAWLRRQRRVAIPFAVILEVETGIAGKYRSDPYRAEELWQWMDELLETDFEYPAATPQVARILGKLLCCKPLTHLWLVNEHAHEKKPGQDLFIAATSIVYDMPIATMNAKDFETINRFHPLPGVYNPSNDMWTIPRCERVEEARMAMTTMVM
ncbi:type II toxin-antitoxin system VapC family toxin [Shinella curvata]|uniref:Type II toxin-antitoxin system VapC family toxin n=1 Tax=Shinella curvata TaxID=1817964 RepID=A0ABT8XNN4_9HYPH|nr:PIN domain-containing protein [Shinella curvata]MCJ8057184.1 type II toxin-antitoxin system VapC family toxin [Shinella curvata]MDO6124969.1 type II toxin-antitoxin system VapC family toxin [Shinella curvata]